jgi:hypothetical protein
MLDAGPIGLVTNPKLSFLFFFFFFFWRTHNKATTGDFYHF